MPGKSINIYMCELLGTLILVLVGCGSAVISGHAIGLNGISIAFGLTLMLLIYAIGDISGCHVNPAVTIGLAVAKKFPVTKVIPYIVAQLIGGIIGAWIVYLIATGKAGFDVTHGFAANGYGPHSPGQYSMVTCALVEVIITALLVFAVLSTTNPRFPAGLNGLVIGFTLLAIHLVSLPVTNTSVNFARSLGVAVFQGGWALEQLWLFAAAQIVGALVGVILYKVVTCSKKIQPV